MILRHIPAAEVKPLWPRVREHLAKIESLEPDWIPEDAYHLLRTPLEQGGAVLTLIADDGFMVWQRYPGDDGRGMLFILALVAYERGGLLKHYPAIYGELDNLAKTMNCKRIRHISPHKSWGKQWRLMGHVFEREVL